MSQSHRVHPDELEWREQSHGERFASRRKQLGKAAGAQRLGCSLFEVPVGRAAFPFHAHLGNEEALYILSGSGEVRHGESRYPVGAGHFVAFPAGVEHAHQVINTGTEVLRYLVVSTMNAPDVMLYPDSDKIGVMGGEAPGGDASKRTLNVFLPLSAEVGYWEGE
ncbi:cupin domain-containing protein [Lujinxingia vulgaris]|uniref:Cupin domain-containing protein n=1 Tax=Lujinxingia vulgaris TaxID=2600176 RepID=A0A5C6WY74_9DELT|nr:cupin domain-containing protein [Lujinxingia vulgaris]TXD34411.1 cupin domain-containing protein [Lujinxingia vulgaris]